jgi:deazaflavin-dependent oxidoreductase (nitroreductase family)
MTLNTPNGTRGPQQSGPSRLMLWMNSLAAKRIAQGNGRMFGVNSLVLVTVGKKSGEERRAPMARFDGGNGSWLVVASANGGARHPAWYFNIGAHPEKVRVALDGKVIPVQPEELAGEERATAWQQITTAQPSFAKYETRTDRVLPVIRLTPIAT